LPVSLVHHVYVHPGEIHWSSEPRAFKTLLGSCVSVCLWDSRLAIGGLTHFILPYARGEESGGRFGDSAVPILIDTLREAGCRTLVAKVFGGAAVLAGGNAPTVGDSNTRVALALLTAQRIPLVAQRTGGLHGMVLQFFSATGEAGVRTIASGQETGSRQDLCVTVRQVRAHSG